MKRPSHLPITLDTNLTRRQETRASRGNIVRNDGQPHRPLAFLIAEGQQSGIRLSYRRWSRRKEHEQPESALPVGGNGTVRGLLRR